MTRQPPGGVERACTTMTLTRPLTQTTAPPTFADAAERHLDDVFGYLLYLTRDRTLADDLSGATFEKALRQWSRFDSAPRHAPAPGCSASPARPHSTGSGPSRDATAARRRPLRRRRRRRPTFVEGLSPELQAALATLSAGEREVLALRIVIELDGDQTARVLGISPTAVSTRLSRALHETRREGEER